MSFGKMDFEYPHVRRDDSVKDCYHGIEVADPYRWLENTDSNETKAFVDAQMALTKPYLELYDKKSDIKKRLTNMWNYERHGFPRRRGDHYFYAHNTGLQNQNVLYVQDSLESEAEVLLDPNTLSDDGTVALHRSEFTEDGSTCAFSLSVSGSDRRIIKFMDVATRKMLPDVLKEVKFSCLQWTGDNAGFFYNRYPTVDHNHNGKESDGDSHQKLYYHRMGTNQSDDVICVEFPENPYWMFSAKISDCGDYLLLSIRDGCNPVNRLHYCDLRDHPVRNGVTDFIPFTKLVDHFDAKYLYITNEGSVFTFKTNLNAPNYKLINIDFTKPEPENWVTLVDESQDVLQIANCVNGDRLILCYLHDVKTVMYWYDLKTGVCKAQFPIDVGSIRHIEGRKQDTEIFYPLSSFHSPVMIYRCDMTSDELKPTLFRKTEVPGFKVGDFETEQVFYNSKDGTRIPMFLVHKKGFIPDGNAPVWMYGYGGFNDPNVPFFSQSKLLFVHSFDGVFALPNIRGGGEYGDKWHQDGMLDKKQNCFDDFQCAAEYLIKENYTTARRLIIDGGSNGGLLVAACVNQRPDLFGAAIASVGIMDMLRFQKFTIGRQWCSEYGCSEKREEFHWLIKISPLHNVREPVIGQYPPILMCTADHDDRVVPLHSYKLIATLQNTLGKSKKQTNPLLMRVETKAGHGQGKPTSKIIDMLTDKLAFMALTLGLDMKNE